MYIADRNSPLLGKFVNPGSTRWGPTTELLYDYSLVQKHDLLVARTVKGEKNTFHKRYHEVEENGRLIGYTIQTNPHSGPWGWFYAPAYPTKTFYTSKGIAFELVVDEDGKVAVEKNKELVEKKYAGNQTLIDTVKAIQAAEILSINRVEVLFAHMKDGQTKAFWAENGENKLAFNNRDDSQPDNSQVSEPIL